MRQSLRHALGITLTFVALLAATQTARAADVNLAPFSNFTFNTPIGLDFHEPAGQLIMSVNYPTGLPNNLDLVAPANAVPTMFSNLAGLTNELKLASVRNTNCTGGFLPGTIFTGNGEPGQLVRISFDGSVVDNPWVTLHDAATNFTETALVRGSIFQDRVCIAGGDLIVVTGNEQEPGSPDNFVGNVWRVTSTGVTTLVAKLNKHLEGVTTVPNDPLHYGPLAGKIIAGDEDFVYDPGDTQPKNGPNGKIYAIDPNTGTFFTIGGGIGSGFPCTPGTASPNGCHYKTAQPFHPEDLDLIRKNSQFFGVAFRDGVILTAQSADFLPRCGQILITQEFPLPGTSGLYALRWDPATNAFIADLLTANFNVQQWEHVTFTSGEDCFVPRLVLTKSPKGATFNIGDTLTFSIVIRNDGDFPATGVTLTDPLPTTGGLTWVVDSVTPSKPCAISAAQVLTCTLGDLAPGDSVTVALRSSNAAGAPAEACTTQKLNNVAQVTSTNAGSLQDTGDYTCQRPSISITKSPKNATFNIGDPLSFTIVVSSNGPGIAQNVTLSDPLPTTGGLTWTVTSVTPSGTCSINAAQQLSCSFGTLAVGQTRTVVVTTSNAGGAPAEACTGSKLNNVATASATAVTPVTDTGDYTCQRPSISITKSPKNATFNIGDPLSFTIVVSSNGPGTAQNVTLSDPLPTTGGLTWAVSSVTPSGTCSINAAQQLSCAFGTLASGQTRTVVVTTSNAGGAPADACTGSKLNNVATASATSLTPVQDTGDYTCQRPSISITKSPKNATFNIGDPLSFTIVVSSNGPSPAQNVTLSDPLPTTGGLTWGVTSVTPAGTCSINAAQQLSCAFGTLAAGQTRTVVVTTSNAGGAPAGACTGGKLNNVATASATGVTPVQDTGDYTCLPPSISITKSPKNATFNIGDPLSFSVIVSSNGPGTAQNVTLSDPLPTTGSLTWAVTGVTPAGTCSINAAQQLSCAFGTLAAGQTRTVVVTTSNASGAPAGACTGGKLNNVATASATGVTPVQDTGDYTCLPPSISITKSPKNATFTIGDPLSFSIIVSSNGPGTAQNVTLSDPLPTTGGLTWVVTSVTPAGTCSINAAQQLSCAFGTLAAGQSRTVVVTTNNAGGAPRGACTGQKLNNVATASATSLTPVQDTGDYTCQPPHVTLVKTPNNGLFDIGEQLRFRLVVTSTGPGTAKNVVLSDPLPTIGGLHWTVVSVTPSGTCTINAAQTLTCNLGDLAANATRTVVVRTNNAGGVPPSACTGAKINNLATVTSTGLDPVTDPGAYRCQPPSLSIVKSPKNASFNIGDPLSFSIVVSSNGPGLAQNVTLTDPLPTTGGLTWAVTSVTPAGTCSINAAQQLSCTFGTLASGQTRTVVVTTNNAGGAPSAACTGQKLNNVATASATGVTPVTDTGDYTCQRPSISITKSPKTATFNIGDPLTFTIVVSSNGPGLAQNVSLSDPLPTTGGLTWAVTSVTPSGTCAINAAQQLSCNFGNLASGQTRTVVVTTNNAAGAPAGACTGQKLNNVATATANALTPAQDTGDYTCQPPSISITKSPKNATFEIGDPLTFTIVVKSNGPGTATNVTMTDPLPTTGGLTWAVTSVTPAGTCSINAAQQLSCAFGNLASGATRTVVVTTNNAGGAPGEACTGDKLNNTATALATGLAPVQDSGDYTCIPSLVCPVTDQAGDGTLNVTTLPNGNFLVVYNQGRTLNDNSYGTGAVWGDKNHSFNDLVGSDHAEFIFKNGDGQVVLQFALDYIGAKAGTPSGFASLGFGGDGDPVSVGNAAHVLAFETSLEVNLNGRAAGSPFGPAFPAFCSAGNCTVNGVNLKVNSPPTISNTSYTLVDPATFGRWIFDDYYAVVIDKAAFGASGFGSVKIGEVHNSPSKGSPGETVECPSAATGSCTLGYPFASDNPRTSVVFNESEVLRHLEPGTAGPGDTIKVFYNDEHALTLGVRRVIVKTASGTTTTDYPIAALPSNPGSAINPAVGTTALTGDQAGTDLAERPMFPALFITDITSDPNSKAGDWQFGGTAISPHAVFGTWKGAVRTVDKTKNPAEVTVTPDADPTKNNWNLGAGSDTPAGGFAGLTNQGYGAEARWNVSDLGLLPGHRYRIQVMVHDGDQNKSGGDVGQSCLTVAIPR